MNIKNTILDELETMAPFLINVRKTLPYTLPIGYFENLSTNILIRLHNNHQLNSDLFSSDDKAIVPSFSIPNDYFANFADDILHKIKTEKIVSAASIIPSVPVNPYVVPTIYFKDFANEILDRIIEEEGLKTKFSKINPYKVPFGYFDSFSANVLGMIYEVDYFEFLNKNNFSRANPYKVPVGYFNNFSNQVLNKISIGISQVFESEIHFSRLNPYKVPVGYFENLPDEVLSKIDVEASKDVPVGYFTALPNIILQKVRAVEVRDELADIAPILNTINKMPVNHVPTAYFKDLRPVLPQAAPVKILGVKRKINWFKNAVAACLIGTLGFTAYHLMDASTTKFSNTVETTKPVITASNTVIPSANVNVDEEISKLDDASLVKYLDNIEMPSEQATVHFNEVNSGDVDKALQDISDETIQQHLDETGGFLNKKN